MRASIHLRKRISDLPNFSDDHSIVNCVYMSLTQTLSPSTVHKYVDALKKLCTFLLSELEDESRPGLPYDDFSRLQSHCRLYKKGLMKLIKRCKRQRKTCIIVSEQERMEWMKHNNKSFPIHGRYCNV